uniref:ferrous iron transporter B n=1 Tax=Enterococcus sp. TaxID=35783 RepID=UPI00289D12FE
MTYHFALAGNPNSGKTSTFNQLTGAKQTVGNWPGVTVERKAGRLRKDRHVLIQDLPGIYSLSPYTPEELISRNYLMEASLDAVINIIDGANLERNLYLTLQLLEMNVPTVAAINMIDLLKKKGLQINFEKLAYGLGIPVVGISALKQRGLAKMIEAAKHAVNTQQLPPRYDDRLEAGLTEIMAILPEKIPQQQKRWFAIKLFEKDEAIQAMCKLTDSQQAVLQETISILEMIFKDSSDAILVNERYGFIEELLALAVIKETDQHLAFSDKIDRVLTHRVLALPI